MKIGLVSSCVPLIFGGGRNIVDWLHVKLQEHGHQSECIFIPNTDEPETILEQMTAFRLLALDEHFDRVITFRPPAHCVRHARKIVWFIHHFRFFYDLWESAYHDYPKTAPIRAIRAHVMRADTVALAEARVVYTNSQTVSDRLLTFNGIRSTVLYPPILAPERFTAGSYGDEIVCISRMQPHKRQELLVDAMRFVRTGVRLRLCGVGSEDYIRELRTNVETGGLQDKVLVEDRWISEDEKVERLATALATTYVPFDEDSYGYPTIEAAHAKRCTVTVADAGGVLEFVTSGETGLVTAPEPAQLAGAFDRLYRDRALARMLGVAAHERLETLGINWQTTVAKLLV
ncbi:MAG: glycosyltransferase family 4 protein [Candidatus Eremiobacteraeota bacterium]|nr:glycosyltransferase family 4 protein [Candidatus Eremiobacteraeota bacterium]MBV8264467.1 glycosyltransferase family 4 protein [Candidatus Eremiobacteraeota bacterium]MBV8339112.1 glycosyltransferase family 4 protein [Candidatus Eremiobacteraeota bacterium]